MRKSVGQVPTTGEQTQQRTVSDVFRHQSRTGKSYCRTRSDVGLERVKGKYHQFQSTGDVAVRYYMKSFNFFYNLWADSFPFTDSNPIQTNIKR
jgi:hypothetical protein